MEEVMEVKKSAKKGENHAWAAGSRKRKADLSDGKQLRYIDVRRFGRFWYLKKDEADVFTGMGQLGIEPDDPQLTAEYLRTKLGNKKKAIKEMLQDPGCACK